MKKLVLKSANQLAKVMNRSQAFKRAWEKVKKATNSDYEFIIQFVKESTGELTTRRGTNAKINSKGNIVFFSLTDNGYRSAKIDNVIGII